MSSRKHLFAAARRGLASALLCGLAGTVCAQTPTPVPVLTWRYDLTHSGANTSETALTPANVASNSFGKLFSLPVDDHLYAQPLYVPNLKMSDGQVHNVLFLATENDTLYAFDADTKGSPIWQVSLLTAAHGASAGATPVPQVDVGPNQDIGLNIGITGTPTINPATNTMYVVSNTKESGQYFSRLHAINIITGAEQPNSPMNIIATVAGNGHGTSGGQISFSPLWTNQRAALNYYNGYVYIAYSSHGDENNYHGWVFAYNATTMQQTAVICLSPNDIGASVWGSGAGMPIDTSTGKMFIVTGNGNRTTPFVAGSDYGQSVVALNIANGQLTPTDEWTAFNYLKLNPPDWDQGSGGLLMLPDQPGPNPHLIITAGKEGRITVLNRDNLGGYAAGASSNTNAVQDITLSAISPGEGFWGTAAYWNGKVYAWAGGDNGGTPNVGMMFQMNNGVMDTKPDSTTTFTSAFSGPTFSVSSNGTQNGIVWAAKVDQFNSNGAAVLYAFDPDDLATVFYESDAKAKDSAGPANRYSVPVVTNGKVYIVANGEVDVYGLLDAAQTAAAPVITPNGGSFTASQSVTLSSTTPSASIFYTLDGSTPTTTSTQYSAPITVSTNTTINAIATAAGYAQSPVSSATFTFANQAPTPTYSPAAGTYINAQTVTISDSDASASVYYTTDGSAPSASSNLYAAPIQVNVTETINAIAIDPAFRNSNVASAAYIIQSGGNTINFGQGFSSSAGLTLNGNAAAASSNALQLTNGGPNQAGSFFWNSPINIQAFTTNFEFQISNAQANGFTFTVQNMGPTALGGNSSGLGYQDIQKSVAVKFNFYDFEGEGSDSTGVYTNGQAPVTPSVDISPSGIQLASGDPIKAQLTYDGTTLTLNLLDTVTNSTFTTSQAINIPQTVGGSTAYVGFTGGTGGLSSSQSLLNWTYSTQALPPAFAPAAGTYSSTQNVALSSGTADATIYYTTDGTAPTAASTLYTSPIAVSTSETINAIAISNTMGTSNSTSAAYVIQGGPTQPAQFALSGTAISIASGASGTSTITVTPSGGFTGTVSLACAIASSPAQAVDMPTCSMSQPTAISGSQAVTATLTVNTTGASASLHRNRMLLYGGETVLAAVFVFWLPTRRRKWQALLGLLVFAILTVGVNGCSSTGGKISTGKTGSGTTSGAYTVTVTGTSGSLQATTAVTLTVQ